MDWLSLLLIVIFFILPLIQQVVEASRRGKQDPAGDESWDPEEPELRDPSRPRAEIAVEAPSSGQGSWSDGWGSWPAPEPVEPRAKETIRPEPPRERVTPLPAPALPDPPPSPRLREVRPREVEIERPWLRLPEQVRSPAGELRVPSGRDARRAAKARHSSPLLPNLGNPAELRRAVVLKEVLGPPVSLRSAGAGGGGVPSST